MPIDVVPAKPARPYVCIQYKGFAYSIAFKGERKQGTREKSDSFKRMNKLDEKENKVREKEQLANGNGSSVSSFVGISS